MANKLNQIVKVNTVNASSSVAATSVNTEAIIVVGSGAAKSYSDLDSVAEDFLKSTAAYKMAKTFFSQSTHPDSLVIIKAASGSAADIIAAIEAAANFDFFHVTLEYALVGANDADKASAAKTFVKALNTKANEVFKMFHVEIAKGDESALALLFGDDDGLTASDTNRVSIWVHDMVGTAIKRIVEITPVIASAAEGSKKVKVTIASTDYEADTTSASTVKSIVDDLVAEINSADSCAFAAANGDGKLVLTAKVGGIAANDVTISVSSTDSGVTISKTSDANGEVSDEHLGVAISSQRCGVDPARGTWAHKRRLVGITPDNWTANELAAAKAIGYNVYTVVAGEARTFMGTTCGPKSFIDTIIKCDWIKFNVEADIYALLGDANEGYGVTYGNTGIQAIGSAIIKRLGIASDSRHEYIMDGFSISVPTLASIEQAQQQIRNVPNIVGRYSVMNAVHTVLDVTLNIVYPATEEAA